MIGDQASRAGTGLAGALGSWAVSTTLGASQIAVVAAVSCAFGMLSSLSRVQKGAAAVRSLAMNAGAVWLAAFVIASKTNVDLAGCVLIGLGVGMAGTAVLEVIEQGVLAVTRRMAGAPVVTLEELDQRLGDERSRVAAVFAEAAIDKHKDESE